MLQINDVCNAHRLGDEVKKKCQIFKFQYKFLLISVDFIVKLTIVDNHHIDLDCKTLAVVHPAEKNKK